MSVEATAWAWEQDVKGTKKLVLLALADHADAEHEAWPALSRLETRVGVGRSSVQDAIRALESEGFLERTARTRANGSRTSTLFRLAIARPDDRADPAGRHTPARLDGQPELSGEPPEDVEAKPSLSLSDQVWATYVEAMEPRDKTLHPAERKLINDALKVATVTECQRAIWGCRRSPFHMGDNSNRKKYNRLSHILKAKRGVRTLREQIDFMLDLADKHAVGELDARGSEHTVIDPAKLERMKRQVWRAFDMPDSEQAAEQGQRAEAWLVEHGWRVVRSGNDRPKIERHDS